MSEISLDTGLKKFGTRAESEFEKETPATLAATVVSLVKIRLLLSSSSDYIICYVTISSEKMLLSPILNKTQ